MASPSTNPNPSLVGDIWGAMPPQAQAAVVTALVTEVTAIIRDLLAQLFRRDQNQNPIPLPPIPVVLDDDEPPVVVTPPEPTDPSAPAENPVVEVKASISQMQYNKSLFPDMYNESNPHGLYSAKRLREVLHEGANANRGSNFWLDLTAYDKDGKEITPDRVKALGLEFRCEHHVEAAGREVSIVGRGPGQKPVKVDESDAVDNAQAAWDRSLGFHHRFGTNPDADNYEVVAWGLVNGVRSGNTIRFMVS